MPSGDEFISQYKLFSYQIEREYFDNAYMKEEFLQNMIKTIIRTIDEMT